MKSEEKLDQCYEAVKDQLPFVPKLALILGSGLGDYADHVTVEKVIPYESIEGFPRSTVAGHKGGVMKKYAIREEIICIN